MCGRYTLTPSVGELLKQLGLLGDLEESLPRYNVAPTQRVPVLRLEEEDPEGPFRADLFRWGLIPSWVRDPSIGNRMINARSETIIERPSFKDPFAGRRCVVLTDGWYEWLKTPGGKQPVRIRLGSAEPFGFAGIWERWEPKKGVQGAEDFDPVRTFAIITAEAAPPVRRIHHRMPVVLKQERWREWLHPDAPEPALLEMLGPYEGGDLEVYPVSTDVNSPANDRPEVAEPVEAELPDLFA
ncbi:MAG: SOS response-associated peptidase [bacterium]